MELQLYMEGYNIVGFLQIILVSSGDLLWVKKPQNSLFWLVTFDPSIVGPPTLVGIGTLELTLVRACVRKILNDYPLYFSEILHEVTTLSGGNVTFSDFWK